MKLEVLDLAVIAAYFRVIVAVALFVGFVTSRKREARASSGYFLAGRSLPWFLIAASLYATDAFRKTVLEGLPALGGCACHHNTLDVVDVQVARSCWWLVVSCWQPVTSN